MFAKGVETVSTVWTLLYTHAVSCNLLPTPTAVPTQSKRAHWCNSHFIHCTTIEVYDVRGCTRASHWASGVGGSASSPVLHRVISDHMTRSQHSSTPSVFNLACFIQCNHWHMPQSFSKLAHWIWPSKNWLCTFTILAKRQEPEHRWCVTWPCCCFVPECICPRCQ